VLTLIVCIFSAGILLFVEARLYAGLDAQLDREIATIGKIYREEPEELKDLASHWGITLFQVDKTDGIRQQTEAWEREGLSRALQPGDSASPLSWTAPSGRGGPGPQPGSFVTRLLQRTRSCSKSLSGKIMLDCIAFSA
jgi:hypothetical protein